MITTVLLMNLYYSILENLKNLCLDYDIRKKLIFAQYAITHEEDS